MSDANKPVEPTPVGTKPVSAWRKVFAAILDFFMVLIVGGYVIASLTGGVTTGGFELNGAPAFALFALIILYFVLFGRYLGGTIWQRLLGVR
jgi:hypothetical protein